MPAHVRRRDSATGSLLAALADAVGSELEVLERDLATLYDSWFVETCPEWVLPYLADLVGVTDLPPALPGVVSRRAFVANTVAYRRRKGTPAVLEQVARDVTGWPAKVVEEFRLLATTSHVDHVRTDRPAAASVRTGTAGGADGTAAGRLDLLPTGVAQAALHALAHTADVRHIASGRGRYGIPNVAVHVFPLQVQLLGRTPARAPGGAPGSGRALVGRSFRVGDAVVHRPPAGGRHRAPGDRGRPAGSAAATSAARSAAGCPRGRRGRAPGRPRRVAGRDLGRWRAARAASGSGSPGSRILSACPIRIIRTTPRRRRRSTARR